MADELLPGRTSDPEVQRALDHLALSVRGLEDREIRVSNESPYRVTDPPYYAEGDPTSDQGPAIQAAVDDAAAKVQPGYQAEVSLVGRQFGVDPTASGVGVSIPSNVRFGDGELVRLGDSADSGRMITHQGSRIEDSALVNLRINGMGDTDVFAVGVLRDDFHNGDTSLVAEDTEGVYPGPGAKVLVLGDHEVQIRYGASAAVGTDTTFTAVTNLAGETYGAGTIPAGSIVYERRTWPQSAIFFEGTVLQHKHVDFIGVSIKDWFGPAFNCNSLYRSNIHRLRAENVRGCNLRRNCQRCTVSDCLIDGMDDGLALHAGNPADVIDYGPLSEITITNFVKRVNRDDGVIPNNGLVIEGGHHITARGLLNQGAGGNPYSASPQNKGCLVVKRFRNFDGSIRYEPEDITIDGFQFYDPDWNGITLGPSLGAKSVLLSDGLISRPYRNAIIAGVGNEDDDSPGGAASFYCDLLRLNGIHVDRANRAQITDLDAVQFLPSAAIQKLEVMGLSGVDPDVYCRHLISVSDFGTAGELDVFADDAEYLSGAVG